MTDEHASSLREWSLDDRSIDYVRDRLLHGGQLSRVVLDRISHESVRSRTFVPLDADPSSVYQFNDAISVPDHHPDRKAGRPAGSPATAQMFEKLVETVEAHLRSGEDAVCLLEEALAEPTDPWLATVEYDYVSSTNGVVMFLTHRDVRRAGDQGSLSAAIRKSSYLFLAILSRDAAWSSWLVRGGSISLTRMRSLVRSSHQFVVGAYDGEGYLYVDVASEPSTQDHGARV